MGHGGAGGIETKRLKAWFFNAFVVSGLVEDGFGVSVTYQVVALRYEGVDGVLNEVHICVFVTGDDGGVNIRAGRAGDGVTRAPHTAAHAGGGGIVGDGGVLYFCESLRIVDAASTEVGGVTGDGAVGDGGLRGGEDVAGIGSDPSAPLGGLIIANGAPFYLQGSIVVVNAAANVSRAVGDGEARCSSARTTLWFSTILSSHAPGAGSSVRSTTKVASA